MTGLIQRLWSVLGLDLSIGGMDVPLWGLVLLTALAIASLR